MMPSTLRPPKFAEPLSLDDAWDELSKPMKPLIDGPLVLTPVPQDKPSALDTQVGGGHYKGKTIQPVQYIHANNLGFCEGNVVKYITRWREKAGLQDLQKVKHYVDLLIELETKAGTFA